MSSITEKDRMEYGQLDESPRWYAVYTKFKTEKYVVERLQKKGIEAYLPLLNITKRYKSKVKKTKIPLFNCYVFVCITTAQKASVLQTEYVYKFVKQTNREEAIPQHEIDLLKQIVGEFEGEIIPSKTEWAPGKPVEVVGGSLTGLKGKLIRKSGKNQFVVELTSIGYELQMEIDKTQLRMIKKVA